MCLQECNCCCLVKNAARFNRFEIKKKLKTAKKKEKEEKKRKQEEEQEKRKLSQVQDTQVVSVDGGTDAAARGRSQFTGQCLLVFPGHVAQQGATVQA